MWWTWRPVVCSYAWYSCLWRKLETPQLWDAKKATYYWYCVQYASVHDRSEIDWFNCVINSAVYFWFWFNCYPVVTEVGCVPYASMKNQVCVMCVRYQCHRHETWRKKNLVPYVQLCIDTNQKLCYVMHDDARDGIQYIPFCEEVHQSWVRSYLLFQSRVFLWNKKSHFGRADTLKEQGRRQERIHCTSTIQQNTTRIIKFQNH